MRTHAGGIKSLLLKQARISEIPSRVGKCETADGKDGQVRYFVAAKLPRYLYLCDVHYLRIRDRLEEALADILREEGLL